MLMKCGNKRVKVLMQQIKISFPKALTSAVTK